VLRLLFVSASSIGVFPWLRKGLMVIEASSSLVCVELVGGIFSHTSSVDKLIDDMSRIYVSGERSSVICIKELLRLVQS